MSDVQDLSANYCPACGRKVENAEAVVASDALTEQGVFKKEGAHLVVEGPEIRVYEHVDGGDV